MKTEFRRSVEAFFRAMCTCRGSGWLQQVEEPRIAIKIDDKLPQFNASMTLTVRTIPCPSCNPDGRPRP